MTPAADLDIVITDLDGKLILSDGHSMVTLEGGVRERFRAQADRYYTPASRYAALSGGVSFRGVDLLQTDHIRTEGTVKLMAGKKNGAGKTGGKANGKSNGAAKKRGGRKSKGEDFTGAAANSVEVRKVDQSNAAELDLQQIEIDDGDFDLHLRAVKGAVQRTKQAKTLYDGACKAAKKVSPLLLDSVKYAIKLEGMDPEDIKAEMMMRGYVFKRTAQPIQITLHDTLLGDVKEQAYTRGFRDGEAGRTANCVYPEGSDLASEFLTGWRNGQAKLLGINVNDRGAHADAAAARADGPEDPDDEDAESDDEPEHDGDAPVAQEFGEAAPAH